MNKALHNETIVSDAASTSPIHSPAEGNAPLSPSGADLKHFIERQIISLKGLQMTPNDVIEEYTGHYPERAGWGDAVCVLTDFYTNHISKEVSYA